MSLFPIITGEDWKRSLKLARSSPNSVSLQLKARLQLMKQTYAQERQEVVELVKNEMQRQDNKWGSQRRQNVHKWHTILSEEVGEAAEATLDFDNACAAYRTAAESSEPDLATIAQLESEVAAASLALECELVQLAAVAIQTVADLRTHKSSQ